MIDDLRNRLRWLTDDCLERRRLSSNDTARTCYWMAAQGAGQALALRHATSQELQAHLNAMEAAAKLGRWNDGHVEEYDALLAAPRPARLFNARQLADMFGMTDRGARKAIKRGNDRRLQGFHRVGKRAFAEREAFGNLISNQ